MVATGFDAESAYEACPSRSWQVPFKPVDPARGVHEVQRLSLLLRHRKTCAPNLSKDASSVIGMYMAVQSALLSSVGGIAAALRCMLCVERRTDCARIGGRMHS